MSDARRPASTRVRAGADDRAAKLPASDPLAHAAARRSATSSTTMRKKIVATKEGGAITGEERLREHLDTLYGAIMSYEGKPAEYQLERIDALNKELGDVNKEFASLREGDLAKTNASLHAKNLPEIEVPAAKAGDSSARSEEKEKNEAHAPWDRD